jgi:hypothetical protein
MVVAHNGKIAGALYTENCHSKYSFKKISGGAQVNPASPPLEN